MEIVNVNQDLCIGCGACAGIASEVFFINDEGLAEVIVENNNFDKLEDSLQSDVLDAIEGCPTGAIQKEEA
ncbi:MAG: ferredoxin [Bacilli bacterium]